MKVRIRNDKKTGETFVDYNGSFNIAKYRYKLLKNIIEGGTDATLIIDSNQKTGEGSLLEAEDFLKRSGIKYSAFPVKQNNTIFFGIEIPRKKINQMMIVMEISGEKFSRELYDIVLKQYDIAVGIGRSRPFEEICDMLKIDISEVLFNSAFFKASIYDSVLSGMLRSSTEIKTYIEAAINETAL